ncbi:MAG TPA: FliA/WhiG family RNA polymerase sigma factor [Syntrophales bacterium]|nr:FliA/WhiG family RNA polymerase sigma factor [Syntrophales bacterium]HRT61029.1 FliA/WhiG family RNA polymerase sigma factor [Syntrophales bacterium]
MDRKERDTLIMKYAPLVKNIVERIAAKVPPHVADRQDLMHVGIIGLISALEKFDKDRNVQFETYARFRIRGAVLDELRARDWQPRSARNKDAKIEKAIFELRRLLGRQPQEEEIADHLGIPLEEYHQLLDEACGVSLLKSEDLPPDYCEKHGSYDVLERIDQGNPFVLLTKNELRGTLRRAIEALPEKEKVVLSLYYYEELTMKEIGLVLRLTESRVCQLHSQAILRLRGRVRELR